MAEAVISVIAEQIVALTVSQALDTVGKLQGVKCEFERLKDIVTMLQPVLDHAEEQYHQNAQIKVWVEKLKDAFYDAQDVLEEFTIEAMRRELRGHNEMMKKVRTFFSSSNQLAFKLKMSDKVRAVREKIEEVKAIRRFHLDVRPDREWRKREDTHSYIREGDIIGRDDDKKAVMEFFQDFDVKENVSILPIVGIGGLGKTALAKYVYEDSKFDPKMWVCVSPDFDVKRIVKDMIACAKRTEPTELVMELLQSKLRAEIEGKKYLLVLDDVWDIEPEKWQSLTTLLMGGARGSKILITTRQTSVANITGTTSPHFLGGLSESASLNLLMQMACRKEEEVQDPDILDIGKEIVRKCSGVPLVVRTIGSLLFKKTKHEWLHFKDHVLPYVSQREDSIISVLRLSYDHLPSPLKQCFAFCSLFPKGYKIEKQTLVNLWVAKGFIQSSNRSQHLEDIAHGYFMDLLWSNFFQDYQNDEYTDGGTCKMHDLMHDLACIVAGTERWVTWDDTTFLQDRTRHICHGLTSNLMGELPISLLKSSALRTFLSTVPRPIHDEWEEREPSSKGDRSSEEYLCQLIKRFRRLRILDMHATNVKKVPRSIGKLKHLTYLDLSYNDALKRLPDSITRLQNLQTLNLSYCPALEALPMGIKKLVSLRNLDINHCPRLSYMPCGLGQLSSLHSLTRFILPKCKDFPMFLCELGELNGLNNIRGCLSIENLKYVTDPVSESKAANLIGKQSLESLKLLWLLQVGKWYLENVKYNWGLQLSNRILDDQGELDDQGTSTDDAIFGDRDEELLNGLKPHSNLKELHIRGYRGESFPRWMMDSLVSSLPNLIEVNLAICQRCKYLPPLGQLPHLKVLRLWWMDELEYIESDNSSSPTSSFPSLLTLEIGACLKLKAIPRAPHLESLDLCGVHPELINRLSSLNKLKHLDIKSAEHVEFLSEECLQSLTSLERLAIHNWPRLTSLSLGMRHLSNLDLLCIRGCGELDLCKDESGSILDFHGLHSLRSVWIEGLPKLESLPQWTLQLPNLIHLQIFSCDNLKELPEQIEALQSLQRLGIWDCPSLTSLPEGIGRLVSLTHLQIQGCPQLEERCKRDAGEDWHKIAHIPHISHKIHYDD